MGMLRTIVGTRVPEKYRKYFNLPAKYESLTLTDTRHTRLGRAAAAWLSGRDGRCGVYRLDLGGDALSIRIGLIESAEVGIDIQSYLIKDDLSGNLVALKLIEAADRGVRIRLLMDDALTEDIDAGLVAMANHENVEVRVFNPFPRRKSRFLSLLANFNVLNRRMHNKSFTVDNQVTIVGGRNLADEYFQMSDDSEFLDEDLLAIGPVVDQASKGFDEFWNTIEAIPVEVFDSLVESQSIGETVAEGRRFLAANADSPYLSRVDTQLIDRLLSGTLPWVEADAHLVLDHPDKLRGLTRNIAGGTSAHLRDLVASARSEVVIVSPYFVPQRNGVAFLGGLVEAGVRVVVITNSLASTNHASVHAVYERYRKPLLKAGVDLYELRPRFRSRPGTEDEFHALKVTLHSKVAVVDRQRLFVGSFNLDPRSLYINTEMGMSVTSVELAGRTADSIVQSLNRQAFSLRLARSGGLRWKFVTENGVRTVAKEPYTNLWQRFRTRLLGLLPIEGQM